MAFYIQQALTLYACTTGLDGNGVSLAGVYRPCIITKTSTGFLGTNTATFSGVVIPAPDDAGCDTSFSAASRAVPVTPGSKAAFTYPKGTPGTWCEATTIIGYQGS